MTTKPTAELDGTALGAHRLQIYAPVFAVDKDLAFALLSYTVNVVESVEDIPAGGATSLTHHADMHSGEFKNPVGE